MVSTRFTVLRLVSAALLSAALLTACGRSSTTHTSGSGSRHRVQSTVTAATSSTPAKPLPPATHTSCRSVVYIGDSTSDGEASAEFVPNWRLRAPAQLLKVGVRTTHMEVSGARSIHELYKGIPNGAMVARRQISAGFHGCWILALGTNEAADVAAGSMFGLRTRIAQMMSIIGNQPVLWVNTITLPNAARFYSEAGMRQWNDDLLAACGKYPMMRVFDWAAHAKPSWFIPDGIHYTPAGYIVRTHLIAHALVEAFPRPRPLTFADVLGEAFPRKRAAGASCLVR
ncbi:MAG: SGNH/GDSL hydrolase family protein [Solirubrobacterales bacterium]|nr:SGNH/GDSL hydrolase family protein [Solirubrobacterales bacterium]MBV9167396.1 SGNH/GDSL hydrolase family protein [Solirubrobacterales bacterium]MBV9534502.1 SGNH/GDSL hydrolase family protein [Solirubrobacterales bacterium]